MTTPKGGGFLNYIELLYKINNRLPKQEIKKRKEFWQNNKKVDNK